MRKIMTEFLWSGADQFHGGKCLVGWNQVQRPLHLGVLGIIDLRQLGIALRLCWCWLARTDPARTCAGLPQLADTNLSALAAM
jgi:hypothetical protein